MNVEMGAIEFWLTVKSKHGSSLEFALRNAAERKKEAEYYYVTGFYADILYKSVRNELKGTQYSLDETCEYGDISLKISVPTILDIQSAVDIVNKVVDKWLKKYNINKMLTDD